MLTALAVFLVCVIVLLAVPLTVSFVVARHDAFDYAVTLRWAFGLVNVDLPSATPTTKSSQNKRVKKKKWRSRGDNKTRGHIKAMLRQSAARRRLFRFARELWRAIGKDDLRLSARVGLGDPADTGRLWALLGPGSAVLSQIRNTDIYIEPDFMDAVFNFKGTGSIRVVPLTIIFLAAALMLSPTLWHSLWLTRRRTL